MPPKITLEASSKSLLTISSTDNNLGKFLGMKKGSESRAFYPVTFLSKTEFFGLMPALRFKFYCGH